MSTALGIAAVTHVLKDVLNDGLINNNVTSTLGSVVNVTSLPPGQVEAANGGPTTQINLFMYRVTPNIGWINTGYPSRNERGDIINNPPLALDLHYLLTSFGDSELHSEVLLGYGMQILHENSVLARAAIRNSINNTTIPDPISPAVLSGIELALSTSELAEQIEQIKITNENINTEEMSRLWTAFQTKYRPCTAYKATVVLIESKKSTSSPLPVQERVFYTIPFKQPVIEEILSQELPSEPVLSNRRIIVGDILVIRGKQLKKDPIAVLINGEPLTPNAADVSDTEVKIKVPTNLKVGTLGVQIGHFLKMGTPAEDRLAAESNLLAFVLSPLITGQSISSVILDGGIVESADLAVIVNPVVYKGQRIMLLLNELNPLPDDDLKSYSFLLPTNFWETNASPSATITFPIDNVMAGTYLIRIQVDGAESPLFVDPLAVNTPKEKEYALPQINIS